MTLALGPFDPAAYLDTPEAVAEYLVAAFESGEQAVIADALGVVAKARGMTQLSRDTGLARPALYRALIPTALKLHRSWPIVVIRGIGCGLARR